MERERRRCEQQPLGDRAGGEPFGRVFDQQPEHGQTMLLRKGCQRTQDILRFQNSNTIETWPVVKYQICLESGSRIEPV